MKAIREDEVAAEAMGIRSFRYKMMAFTVSGFFEGIAGGLLAHLITTISPVLFTFFLTFNLLIIIVVGGLGSITGSVISSVLFVLGSEALRAVEEPFSIGSLQIPGNPGHADGDLRHPSRDGDDLCSPGNHGPRRIFLARADRFVAKSRRSSEERRDDPFLC